MINVNENSKSTCPGIKVKNFTAINAFLLIVKLKPNPYSVLNDKTIPLKSDKKFIADDKITFNEDRIDANPTYRDVKSLLDKYKDYFQNIKDKVSEFQDDINKSVNPEEAPTTVDCPIDNLDLDKVLDQLKNGKDPEFAKEVYIDPKKSETYDPKKDLINYCNEADQFSLLDQIKIPEINMGKYKSKVPKNIACLFNDDKLKSVGTYIDKKLLPEKENLINDMHDQIVPDSLKDMNENMKKTLKDKGLLNEDDLNLNTINAPIPDNVPTIDILKDKYNINFELGIPIATLDSKNEIHLQIVHKKIQVTNLIDFAGNILEIDKEIDLNENITIGFYTNGVNHRLYYINNDTGEMLEKDLTIKKNLTIECIGIDDLLRKHFCGLVFDIQILTFQKANMDYYLKNSFSFDQPAGALYYYDWHQSRIRNNLVFPLPNLEPPVKMYSENGYTNYILHTEKQPYHFMELGYLTQFFCWRTLNKKDFSIGFWFNKLEYKNGDSNNYKTLIYDELNNYALKYCDDKKFKIVLGKYSKTFHYLIEDNMWYFCNFKYCSDENKLYFNIRNIDQKHFNSFTEFSIDLKKEKIIFKQFHLSAILARKNESYFDEEFRCKFGTLALFDYKRESSEEYNQFFKERIIIKNLKL